MTWYSIAALVFFGASAFVLGTLNGKKHQRTEHCKDLTMLRSVSSGDLNELQVAGLITSAHEVQTTQKFEELMGPDIMDLLKRNSGGNSGNEVTTHYEVMTEYFRRIIGCKVSEHVAVEEAVLIEWFACEFAIDELECRTTVFQESGRKTFLEVVSEQAKKLELIPMDIFHAMAIWAIESIENHGSIERDGTNIIL